MNKISNVVYSGWMVKSPPEKKYRLTGPWKIFRAFAQDATDTNKWKRRFFVLFKPASSLPHQYLLNYYTDEHCKKLKGCIDLEHCEQVIESLDLDIFPFLLALKTFHKGRERTYFLSTDTEDEMTTWVRNLCSVCGLKPEESPDLPPEKPDHDSSSAMAAPVAVVPPRPHRSQTMISQPQSDLVKMRGRSIGRTNSKSGSHYIPLSDCLSEKSRRSSIPDEVAPPPPQKAPKAPAPLPEGDDNVFQQPYDTPKQRVIEDDSDSAFVYKVPPPRREEGSTLEVYDIPPPARQSPSTPRSSSSESQKDSAYSSQSALTGLTYDYPPSHPDRGPVSDEVYDFPPPNPQMIHSQSDVPPPRPPKASTLNQEPYQNLPSNSVVVKEHTQTSMDLNVVVPPTMSDGAPVGQSYDVPRAQNAVRNLSLYDMPKPQQNGVPKKDSSLLAIPPPPHSSSGMSSHSYINAGRSYVPIQKDKVEDAYLPMERAFPPSDSLDHSAYSDMSRIPTSPVNMNYTDMSALSPDYDTPPKPGLPPRISPRTNNDHAHEGMTRTEGDTYTIFSNARTRSFKRNNCIDHSGRVDAPTTLRVQLPYMSNNRHPDFSTSSEEEDEPVLGDPSQVMMPYSVLTGQGGHSSSLWSSTPPAPKQQEAELQYLDLALDDTSDKEAMRSPHSHTGHSTPTEYREIDFVKTQALSDVKKTVDNQRKHDDQ
ncbi:GRB2-associated-binding protein 1-like isoform X2 [Ylistrum balloti]|uniref:GRB2-associated-binding protein 1-like isoform X2 n=1 Tax=Ylistrum balloti TaxID=509963 RepID=UPI002905BE97|nr:GRB2-associated-binding protein 1-like isoform X2 [Ylistrum balloti]